MDKSLLADAFGDVQPVDEAAVAKNKNSTPCLFTDIQIALLVFGLCAMINCYTVHKATVYHELLRSDKKAWYATMGTTTMALFIAFCVIIIHFRR